MKWLAAVLLCSTALAADHRPVNVAFPIDIPLWDGAQMLTEQSVTVSVQRLSDSNYWTGSAWGSYTALACTELTGNASLTGVYRYTLSQAAIGTTEDVFKTSSTFTSGATTIVTKNTLYTDLPSIDVGGAVSVVTTLTNLPDGGGLTTDQSDMLTAIFGKLGSTTVTVQSQVASNGTLTLVQGDDYYSTSSLTLTRTAWPGESIVGGTVAFSLMTRAVYDAGTGAAALSGVSCTFTNGTTGSTIVVTIPLTAAQTAALAPSPAQNPLNYVYQVLATTSGGKLHTLFLGACTVKRGAR